MNQGAQYVRHLENMIVLARVIAQGARNRDESRGAHFKPEFPQRDDASWLRTTLALARRARPTARPTASASCASSTTRSPAQRVHVTDAVDTSLVRPRPRKYETAGAASAVAERDESGRRAEHRSPRRPPPRRSAECRRATRSGSASRCSARTAPGMKQLLAGVRGPLAAAHERHQRAHGDPEAPGDGERREDDAGRVGVRVPRGGVRLVHDAGQRQGAAVVQRDDRRHRPRGADDHPAADDEVPRRARPRRRPLADVRGPEARARVDPARRLARPRPRPAAVAGEPGDGVPAVALHDVRLLPRGVPADQPARATSSARRRSTRCASSTCTRAARCTPASGSTP